MTLHPLQAQLLFTSIHRLLTDRSYSDWETYWNFCVSDNEQNRPFMDIVHSYIHEIKSSKAERVLLINEDKRLFLAGFLATLTVGIPIILPPSKAPDVLEELYTSSTFLLNDKPSSFQEALPLILSEINPAEARIIFFTSGSTGTPKTIEKTLHQLETEIVCLEKLWGNEMESCRFLSTVPHHHIYGLLFSLLWPVSAGRPLNLQTTHFWEDIMGLYSPGDILVSGPSHLGRLSPLLVDSPPLEFLRIFSSGAPLSLESSQRAFKHLGALPTEILGSTETGGIAYRQQDCEDACWTPFPNTQINTNEDECLSLNSPFLPDTDNFQTQDRIRLNKDQTFTLLGRADRIVKIEGKRVSLDEIEQSLIALDEISQIRIIPLLRIHDESFYKDELGAVAVLSPLGIKFLENRGKAQLGTHFHQHLKATCEPMTIPRRWRFISEFPVSDTGKISLQVFQDIFKGKIS